MARQVEEFRARITAEDDASPVIKKIGRQLEGLSEDEAEIVIRANIAELQKQLRAAKREITKLSDEDVQIQARVIGEGERELRDLKDRVEDLDGKKIDIDTTATRRGIDDVGKSADSSKSALANMIGNTTQDLGAMGGIAGSVGVAVGQIGEYAADAALEGESLGVVFKSFAAVAGPIAALSVAMAVMPVIIEGIVGSSTDADERTKELTESIKKQTDAVIEHANAIATTSGSTKAAITDTQFWNKVISEGGDDVTAFRKGIASLGLTVDDATFLVGRARGSFGGLASDLAKHGDITDHTATAVANAVAQYHTWDSALFHIQQGFGKLTPAEIKQAEALLDIGRAADSVDISKVAKDQLLLAASAGTATTALVTQAEGMTGVSRNADDVTGVYSVFLALLQGTGPAAQAARDELSGVASASQDGAKAAQEHAAAIEAETQALKDQVEAGHANADALFAVNKAIRDQDQAFQDLQPSIDEINKSKDDADTKTRKVQQLYDDTAASSDNLAQSIVTQADEQAKANGVTLGATQKLDLYNESMLQSASSAEGPLRDAIVGYIAAVNNIPPEKVSEILATTPNLAEQEQKLNEASRARTTTITVSALGLDKIVDDLNRLQREKHTVFVDFEGRTHVGGAMAGTPHWQGGPLRVGEAGPETVWLPRGSKVDTAGRTMMADARSAQPIVVNYHITLNVPPTVNPAEIGGRVVEAIQAFERRSGKGWRAA